VETLESRITAINTELQSEPSAKSLQGLLQGTLLLRMFLPRPLSLLSARLLPHLTMYEHAEVHAGPQEMCKAFLMQPDPSYADADRQKLRTTLKALLEACGRALRVNSEVLHHYCSLYPAANAHHHDLLVSTNS